MITQLNDEFHEVAQVYYEAVHGAVSRWYTPAQIDAGLPDLSEFDPWRLRCQERRVFVYKIDGRAVGFVGLLPDGRLEGPFVVMALFRRGVTQALVDHVTAVARELGLDSLTAVTSDPLIRTVLRHAGFLVAGSQPLLLGSLQVPGIEVRKVLREIRLPRPSEPRILTS